MAKAKEDSNIRYRVEGRKGHSDDWGIFTSGLKTIEEARICQSKWATNYGSDRGYEFKIVKYTKIQES